ncbi:sodium pump decarboxylase gamma subunit [Elusimicrobium simillimum]|uniref:OadG family protein n=1 Tax=Elusimicrobium simillimum TaxID=3143438 RepID=UPI003C7038BB
MNESGILMQGVMVTAIGMSFVFIFLTFMIGAMNVLKYAVAALDKVLPLPQEAKHTAKADHGKIALAIAAARKFAGK